MSILQYLTHYAEPECAIPAPSTTYDHVVVVPAFDESPKMLDGYRDASAGTKTLWIIVVNASDDRSTAEKERTRYLASALSAGGNPLTPGAHLCKTNIGDLLVIDRASVERELPSKQGVGLARKIGCDVALAWHKQGVIESTWIHCTDADVTLPAKYFEAARVASQVSADRANPVVALCYPFWHQCEASSLAGRASALYEMSLRYYMLGLSWARSNYAFHCIGSTMAIQAKAYYQVRGMPKREAGEDFYLLNKVAKLGQVWTPTCEPILIAQRESARTPFGTGPATRQICEDLRAGQDFRVYHPSSFALLREWLAALDDFSESCDLNIVDSLSRDELRAALPMNTQKHLREAAAQCKSSAARKQRLHTWFDGFRTLKLIHALRDQGLSDCPWNEAVDSAPFMPAKNAGQSLREAMAARERHLQDMRI